MLQLPMRSSTPPGNASETSRSPWTNCCEDQRSMTERSIIEAAARLRRQREPYLVATVACVRGSAYRRPGARMLLTQFRWIAGSVSGGCLEGDIASKGWWRTQGGEPVLVT